MIEHMSKSKKDGQYAAKAWIESASINQQIALAGCDFRYRDTLSELAEDGYEVPTSNDADFSWGFFKTVKGKVHTALHSALNRRKKNVSSGNRR
jgi:hypothetical protein